MNSVQSVSWFSPVSSFASQPWLYSVAIQPLCGLAACYHSGGPSCNHLVTQEKTHKHIRQSIDSGSSSLLFLIANIVTSKALVPSSEHSFSVLKGSDTERIKKLWSWKKQAEIT